jgi:uncharacterized membrane protein YkoI
MQTTKKTTARRIALVAALPLVGALALAGCATDDDDRDDVAAPAASAPSVSATEGATTDDDPAAGGSTAAPGEDALVAAATTARKAVGSGTVTSVEQEAGGTSWEVLVVTSGGDEHEVHVAADGERTTAGPTKETADADDVAENERFVAAADLSVAQAASTLTKTVRGTVTELGLDDHAGTVVWEGDVLDGSGTTHSIRIDAGTGKVVTETVDTDD